MMIGMMLDMYKPYISGVTNHVEINTRALTNAGHSVTIFTLGGLDHDDSGEVVCRSKGFPLSFPFADLTIQLGRNHTPEIIDRIQSMDILNIHHPFMSGDMAYRYTRGREIPVVFTSHTRYDLYAEIYTPFLPRSWVRRFMGYQLQSACRKFDAVITPSRTSRQMYADLGVEARFIHVPNGIFIDHILQTQEPVSHAKLGLGADDRIIVYLGRIGPEKNLDVLLRAFAQVRAQDRQVKLLMVGRGTELKKLKQITHELGLDDAVVFTGFVPYEEVPAYLRLGEFFVTTSTTEIHPLSVLEAMAAGLAIVGVDASGVGEVVEHGVSGLLSGMDEAQIAGNILTLLRKPDLAREMGEKALTAVQRFNIDVTHKQLLSTYTDLIAEKRITA